MTSNTDNQEKIDAENVHYVAKIDEIKEGDRFLTEIQGREICFFNHEGDFYALANYCPHQGGPVCKGLVAGTLDVDESFDLVYSKDGEVVSCPWHGWEFDIKTGDHLAREKYRVPTYSVVQQDDSLYVEF